MAILEVLCYTLEDSYYIVINQKILFSFVLIVSNLLQLLPAIELAGCITLHIFSYYNWNFLWPEIFMDSDEDCRCFKFQIETENAGKLSWSGSIWGKNCFLSRRPIVPLTHMGKFWWRYFLCAIWWGVPKFCQWKNGDAFASPYSA